MAQRDEKKTLQDQMRDAAIDVRNEVIVQSANVYLMARKALLASLGAMAMTLEETNEFVDKLVERGEMAEADVQKLINDLRAHSNEREKVAGEARKNMVNKAGMALEESVEVILNRLNVPTKTEIEELSKKIGSLNQKVSALMEQKKPE
ncbi:MAG: phasin family protein [Caldilineaceae bacterium]